MKKKKYKFSKSFCNKGVMYQYLVMLKDIISRGDKVLIYANRYDNGMLSFDYYLSQMDDVCKIFEKHDRMIRKEIDKKIEKRAKDVFHELLNEEQPIKLKETFHLKQK